MTKCSNAKLYHDDVEEEEAIGNWRYKSPNLLAGLFHDKGRYSQLAVKTKDEDFSGRRGGIIKGKNAEPYSDERFW